MSAKILFVTDLHKRDTDFTSIVGYTRAIDAVQRDLLAFIQKAGITHMVSTGDWYDKGYRNVNRLNSDRNWDEEFKRVLNGNFYMCIGNHFFLERDNNPEMYLIQPNDKYKPTKPVTAFEPIIKTPQLIKIGTVQISLMHFDKESKDYKVPRDPDTTYHIGVYHDECVVPSTLRQRADFPGETSSAYLYDTFSNVDLAIVGHLHTPIGVDHIQLPDKKVTMIIPGSMCITKNKASELHTETALPVIEIDDNNNVKCTLYRFMLHTDLLKFYNKREAKAANSLSNSAPMPEGLVELPTAHSVVEYLASKGYDNKHIEVVKQAAENPMDPVKCMRLLGTL